MIKSVSKKLVIVASLFSSYAAAHECCLADADVHALGHFVDMIWDQNPATMQESRELFYNQTALSIDDVHMILDEADEAIATLSDDQIRAELCTCGKKYREQLVGMTEAISTMDGLSVHRAGTTVTTTNQLVVNTTNTTGDGVIVTATSPAAGKCAMRYELNGANVFRVLKSTGGVAVDTSASTGAEALNLIANVASDALALNAGNGAFTIVSGSGDTATKGTITFKNGGSNIYFTAGSTAASTDIQTGTGIFSAETSTVITFDHAFGATPTVLVIPTTAQSSLFNYYVVSATSDTEATIEAYSTANALLANSGSFAYIAIGQAA